MAIKIKQAKPAPSKDQVLGAETELGVTLPAEYVKFLNTGNGGIPETNIFRISADNEGGINEFIALNRVPYEAALIKEQTGSNCVPIAYAEGGNYVCIVAAGPEAGSIYFFDHEIPGTDALTKLAGSLREFLDVVVQPFDPKQKGSGYLTYICQKRIRFSI